MQEEYDNEGLAEDTLADGEQEGEFFEHFRIVVDKGQDLLRIDKFCKTGWKKHHVPSCKMPPRQVIFW